MILMVKVKGQWNSTIKKTLIFNFLRAKAELLQEGIIFLIQLFARAILLIKKLKIKETKAI